MDYAALKTELDDDPKQLGLDGTTDEEAADLLNTPGLSSETITRELVNTADIVTAIYSDETEFMAISQLNLVRLNLLSPVGDVDPTAIQSVIKEIFTQVDFPNIRAALTALAIRDASRAEKLFGQSVSLLDVHKARRL